MFRSFYLLPFRLALSSRDVELDTDLLSLLGAGEKRFQSSLLIN